MLTALLPSFPASSTGEACRHFRSGTAALHFPACGPPRPCWACLCSLPVRHVPGGQPELVQLGGHARARGRGVLVHGCHGGRFEGPLCLQRRRYTASEQAPFFYQLHSVVGYRQRVAACLGCMACWMLCALQSGSLIADRHGSEATWMQGWTLLQGEGCRCWLRRLLSSLRKGAWLDCLHQHAAYSSRQGPEHGLGSQR